MAPNRLQVPGLYLLIGRVLMLHDGPTPGTMNGPSPDTDSPLHGLNYAIGTGNSLGRDTPPRVEIQLVLKLVSPESDEPNHFLLPKLPILEVGVSTVPGVA